MHHHMLEVDLNDLIVWNEDLAQKVHDQPGELVPLVSPSLADPCVSDGSSRPPSCGSPGSW